MVGRWWPFRVSHRPLVATVVEPAADEAEIDTQAVRAILALAIERYQYEHGRTKDIESKAGPTLGLAGAILILAAGRLNADAAPCLAGRGLGVYIAGLLVAVVCLLLTLRIKPYLYFDLADWVRLSLTRRPKAEVRDLLELIAGSYREYTEANRVINNTKAGWYARSLLLLSGGVTLIALAALWSSCVLPPLW
jgi:hypothetical protein